MKKLAVLASHRGTNFQAILDACDAGRLPAKVVLTISNNSQSQALQRAKNAGIETLHISALTHPDEIQRDEAICTALTRAKADLVVTAGYMKKLGTITTSQFSQRIVNVHPSLLPKHGGKGMFGNRVHQSVLDSQETETGLTVHLVDSDYDTGAILSQKSVPVLPNDTVTSIAARVLEEEHEMLVSTLAELLT